MDMQNMEQSRNSLERLTQAIAELETVLRQQKEQFQQTLGAEKQKTADMQVKVADLEQQIQTLTDDKEKLKRMHKLTQEFFVESLKNSQTALDYLHNKRHLDDKLISEF